MGEQLGERLEDSVRPEHIGLVRRAVFGEDGLLIMDAKGEMFGEQDQAKSVGERVVASEVAAESAGATLPGIRLKPAA